MPVIIELKSSDEIIKYMNLDESGKLHSFFTETCALHMDKYVPFDEGILAGTVVKGNNTTTNVTTDEIIYDQEYASYQYFGERKDGSHKTVNRSLDMHPLATSYWDEHMWTAEKETIEKEVENEFKRLNGGIR
jgi:hypothetical protein